MGNNSLYLRIPGFTMVHKNESERVCPTTRNRILIYNNENALVQKVCPASYHQLGRTTAHAEIYSEDFREFNSPLYPTQHPVFKIEFIGRELGNYRIHWLQLVSARMMAAFEAVEKDGLRMGEAARAAGGGVNGTGFERGAGPWEDPLWRSMFDEDLNGKLNILTICFIYIYIYTYINIWLSISLRVSYYILPYLSMFWF
jgi:hypothetical protein